MEVETGMGMETRAVTETGTGAMMETGTRTGMRTGSGGRWRGEEAQETPEEL